MTRQDHSRATVEWMQAVLASDEDLLALGDDLHGRLRAIRDDAEGPDEARAGLQIGGSNPGARFP